ncbi:DNA translocase FtsK [Sporosarcina jeotgali]|uniref:DNA translocase FtsK n=1 Tax=Sporosarcina jeotgali TaxID=3020056 RepID=A0ABZ0KSF8_9BACL|nr:DNA translocase FtsK [Sporosarcina sp. B2O-1]WOV83241.1 DNA translocase FtsK [Sporosarcina sp. B2O-1]
MSWIKKTMSRLFGSESDEELQDLKDETFEEVSDEVREYEQPQETNSPQRPAFRFPMITDAEIYGWDEDPHEPVQIKKQESLPVENKDTTETIPLYKNNRWPAEPPIGEIHRAGSRTKYKEQPERSKTVQPKVVKQVERKSEIVKQRTNKPFTPTEVPSPVYGFSQPKRASVKIEHEITSTYDDQPDTKKVPPSNLFLPKEVLPSGRKIGTPVIEDLDPQHVVGPEIEVNEVFEEQPESSSSVADQPEADVVEIEDRNPLISTTDQLRAEINHEQTLKEETISDHVQIAVLEPDSEELDQVILDEKDFALDVLEEQETDEEHTELDDLVSGVPEVLHIEDMQEAETDSHSEPEKASDEKIVPFNVVMLKSDKEKQQLRSLSVTDAPAYKEPASVPVRNEQPAAVSKGIQFTKTETQNGSNRPVGAVQPPPLNIAALPEETEDEEQVLPHYVFPSMEELLPAEEQQEDTEWLTSQSEKLVEALSHFAVEADILEAVQGPTVTRFELIVGFGTKVSKVRNLTDDLKLALAAEDIRIQAPIPGTSSIGIEIPNRTTRPVRISEVIDTEKFSNSESPLEAVLGLSLTGEPVTIDLRKMPHGMIAGATGSGKSVCINSILVSLLYKASPTELKMMLIDPKMVELAPFNGIPHLISPVITDVKAATAALKWAVDEMERRYELFAHAGARNIERYNQMAEASRQFSQKMPYLLIVIDELADLMMVAPNDVEVSISRIAQKARACGIHLIIATQRPSVDVITGIIKANIPTRIAFAVSSQIDSRTIIDGAGAERLLGRGDMLYIGNGQSSPIRLQGTFVTDDEIESIIDHVKSEAAPEYLFGQEDLLAAVVEEEESDPLFTQACSFIIEQGSASTSLMQRHFSIGYNRAAKIMDRMEAHGFISEQRGSRSRDVYLTEADLESFLNPDHEA